MAGVWRGRGEKTRRSKNPKESLLATTSSFTVEDSVEWCSCAELFHLGYINLM